MIDEVGYYTSDTFGMGDPYETLLASAQSYPLPIEHDVSESLKKYFFEKMGKKGFGKAEKVYEIYLKTGFSPKAAITLTDRKFFPSPHEKGHGNYLKNVIGEELFKKEQVARKEKSKGIQHLLAPAQDPEKFYEKINAIALQSLGTAKSSKKNKYPMQMQTRGGDVGQYVLGIGEMALGVGLMATGVAVEIGTCGVLTVGVALEMTAAAALVGDGLARTMGNRDISFDPNFSDVIWQTSDVYVPDRPLPRDPHTKEPAPETDAPHTELGTRDGDHGKYPQAREFDGEGKWKRDIDFTDHGRPQNHDCPHQHEYLPNPTGGTPKRDPFGKPVPEWDYP